MIFLKNNITNDGNNSPTNGRPLIFHVLSLFVPRHHYFIDIIIVVVGNQLPGVGYTKLTIYSRYSSSHSGDSFRKTIL